MSKNGFFPMSTDGNIAKKQKFETYYKIEGVETLGGGLPENEGDGQQIYKNYETHKKIIMRKL